MRLKQMIRPLAICLTLSIAFTMGIGCSNEPTSQTQTTSSQANGSTSSPSYTQKKMTNINAGKTVDQILSAGDFIIPVDNIKFPISKTPITLKGLRQLPTLDVEPGKMPVLMDYEKKTNIHIEWNTPPAAGFLDKFNLIMASGDMPDFIIGLPVPGKIGDYGRQGALLELKSLISKNGPNLQQIFDEKPAVKKLVADDEGMIYSLPFLTAAPGNSVMMLRQDWLDKLKLQVPTTTDEWYTVLKAFKTLGTDVYPLSSYGPSESIFSLSAPWGVFWSFYIADSDKKVFPKDNKIHFGAIDPRFKEALQWMIKLYTEKLIDPEFVTNDVKVFQAKALNDKIGVWRGMLNGDLIVLNDTAKKNGKTLDQFHIVEMPIMKGPYGDQVHFGADDFKGVAGTPGGFCITKSNKYPIETMQWADYWYSEIGTTFGWGINGVTYTIDSKGEAQWTDYVMNNPAGKTMNEIRGSISWGRSTWPSYSASQSLVSGMAPPEVEAGRVKYRLPELMTRPLPSSLTFTQSESDKIAKFETDVRTYVTENLTNFIIGKKPISEWDSYVAKVKSMGIDDLIKVYQDAYDRWSKR